MTGMRGDFESGVATCTCVVRCGGRERKAPGDSDPGAESGAPRGPAQEVARRCGLLGGLRGWCRAGGVAAAGRRGRGKRGAGEQGMGDAANAQFAVLIVYQILSQSCFCQSEF